MTNVTDVLIHDNLIIVDTDGDLITVFTESNRDIMEDDRDDDYDHSLITSLTPAQTPTNIQPFKVILTQF